MLLILIFINIKVNTKQANNAIIPNIVKIITIGSININVGDL